MSKHYGVIVSAVMHVLILLIPISMTATPEKQEIELFMSMEDTHPIPNAIQTQQKQAFPQRVDIREPHVAKNVEQQESITIPEEAKREVSEAITETRGTDEPERERIPEKTITVADKTPAPIDTEFGAAIAPTFLHREMPVYPAFARKLGREGRVVLRLTIDENGNLVNVEVVEKAGFGFVEAAMDAVRKSTFLPAYKNGKPIASRALLPVRFTIRRDS